MLSPATVLRITAVLWFGLLLLHTLAQSQHCGNGVQERGAPYFEECDDGNVQVTMPPDAAAKQTLLCDPSALLDKFGTNLITRRFLLLLVACLQILFSSVSLLCFFLISCRMSGCDEVVQPDSNNTSGVSLCFFIKET